MTLNSEFRSNLKICGIVVTFNPNLRVLEALLNGLLHQVDKIYIVDNASSISVADWINGFNLESKIELKQLETNCGVGFAQNVGIRAAREEGSDFVVLLDQDSRLQSDMVDKLLEHMWRLHENEVRVAAVGPSYKYNKLNASSGFVKVGWLGYGRVDRNVNVSIVETDFLISSGCLIPISVIEQVGDMDEALFIDHVDTEWCLRARAKGFKLFGVSEAHMIHPLGDSQRRIWILRWRTISFHAPFRYYYIFRNSILLLRRSYIPLRWKSATVTRCVMAFVFFGLLSTSRAACIRMMMRGVHDGLKGVSGKIGL